MDIAAPGLRLAPDAAPPDSPMPTAPPAVAEIDAPADRRREEAVFFSDHFGRVGSPEGDGDDHDGESPADVEARLRYVTGMMREVSRQRTPADLVRTYSEHMRRMLPLDRLLTLSRRGEPPGRWRVTRDRHFDEAGRDVAPPPAADLVSPGGPVLSGPAPDALLASTFGSPGAPDPWRDRDRHPAFDGGFLGDLLYGNRPVMVGDVDAEIDAGRIADADPARRLLAGYRSLLALPLFDDGEALNMAVMMRSGPHAFPRDHVAQHVLISNLFGRATSNLVLGEEIKAKAAELKAYAGQLKAAKEATDRELAVVAQMQRSFLPSRLPTGHGLDLAAHYQTAAHAGGDYYDFFPLPGGKLGILVADVSGHGTAAAVLMAITHSLAHAFPVDPGRPVRVPRPPQPRPDRPLHRRDRHVRHRLLRRLRPRRRHPDPLQRRPQPPARQARLRRGPLRGARRRPVLTPGHRLGGAVRRRDGDAAPGRPAGALHRRHHRGPQRGRPRRHARPARCSAPPASTPCWRCAACPRRP